MSLTVAKLLVKPGRLFTNATSDTSYVPVAAAWVCADAAAVEASAMLTAARMGLTGMMAPICIGFDEANPASGRHHSARRHLAEAIVEFCSSMGSELK